jgi:hypothetical protein
MTVKRVTLTSLLGFTLAWSVFSPSRAQADIDDPPYRVARVAYIEGSVSFQPAGTQDWVAAPLNRPLTTGDTLWSDQNSRAELQLDGSVIRLASASELSFVNLNNEVTQIRLTSGTLLLRVRRLDDNETYEVDTPNLAFTVLRPGVYRIGVDASGNSTTIIARSGQAEVTGGGAAYTVYAGDYDIFSGADQLAAEAQPSTPDPDAFEIWSADRDSRWDRSLSARYVPDTVGYEDLDEYGSWRTTAEYGSVWYPSAVAVDWAPYRTGHWCYIDPWGYTWVDDRPWGFAPFHYGRWVWGGGVWGWVPAPLRVDVGIHIRPVYAPALVAWVAAGAGIAWFALGPREVYVPSYPVSPTYVRNINVSNTTVNTTVINNVYNTIVINKKTVDITYVNRAVPGAVSVASTEAFAAAQPVQRNLIKVDQRAIAGASVRALAPAVVPTKQAVLGSSPVALAKPPASLHTRPVVARTPPPPPPPPFELRQEAIKKNGGKPLSVAQIHQIPSVTPTARNAAIRMAPPASPVSVAKKPGRPTPLSAEPPKVNRPPPSVAMSRPAPAAIHPKELPALPKPASPSVANSVIEREHLQQQQQLRAQQDQERLRAQLQQDLEHQQLAKQQADAARTQELERLHQQQTQLLQQRHIQQQQQLAANQLEQRRAAIPAQPRRPP